jgi:hypothetical protein
LLKQPILNQVKGTDRKGGGGTKTEEGEKVERVIKGIIRVT